MGAVPGPCPRTSRCGAEGLESPIAAVGLDIPYREMTCGTPNDGKDCRTVEGGTFVSRRFDTGRSPRTRLGRDRHPHPDKARSGRSSFVEGPMSASVSPIRGSRTEAGYVRFVIPCLRLKPAANVPYSLSRATQPTRQEQHQRQTTSERAPHPCTSLNAFRPTATGRERELSRHCLAANQV